MNLAQLPGLLGGWFIVKTMVNECFLLFVFTFSHSFDMTWWSWATPAQKAWLESNLASFLQAKQEKGTTEFIDKKVEKFLVKWPVTLTEGKLCEAKDDKKHVMHVAVEHHTDVCVMWLLSS